MRNAGRARFRAATRDERQRERRHKGRPEKSNYNSPCIVGVIIGARAPIMEVQRRLRTGRHEWDAKREETRRRLAGAGKKNEGNGDGGGRGTAGAAKRIGEKQRTLGIASMTYVPLTLSARRL